METNQTLIDLSNGIIRVIHQKNNGWTYLRILMGSNTDNDVFTPAQDVFLALNKEKRAELIKALQETL